MFHVSLQKTRVLRRKSPVLLRSPQRELTRSSAFWVSAKPPYLLLTASNRLKGFMRVLKNDFFPICSIFTLHVVQMMKVEVLILLLLLLMKVSAFSKTFVKKTSGNPEVKHDGCSLWFTDKVDDSLDDLLDDLEHKQKTTKKTELPSSSSPAAPQKTVTGEKTVTSLRSDSL